MRAPQDSRSLTTIAFDRLAPEYDSLSSGEIFRLVRDRTHRAFARSIAEGARVLEIGCGTGLDTRFLAARSRHVVACDPSEEMVTRALRRVAREGLETRVTIMPCGLQDLQTYLDALTPREPFDAIVSNFGALNCISHLAPLGALVRRHLRPGGVVLLGLMARMCAFEAIYFTAIGRAQLASRRLGAGAVAVSVAGVDVPTYYHRIRDVRAALGEDLHLLRIEGIGVAIPPLYLEPRWRELPRHIRAAVTRVDSMVASLPPFNRLGDHVLLLFRKEPVGG